MSKSPQPDPMIWWGAVLSLVAGAALFWANQPTEEGPTKGDEPEAAHPLAFPPLPADAQDLERARARKYSEARETLRDDPEAARAQETLLKLVRQANRRQFEGGSEKADGLSRQISVAANDVIRFLSYDTFPAAGAPLYAACSEALSGLLEAVQSGDLELGRAETDPPRSQFAEYRANCGMLLPVLTTRGLVDESGRWSDPAAQSKAIVGVLQRVRWAHMTHDRRPFLLQLTPEERTLYLRWRIESPQAFSLEDRQHFLSKLAADKGLLPDYDVQLAQARLEWAAGRADAARQRLRDALDGASPAARDRYRRALDWLSSNEASPSNEDG